MLSETRSSALSASPATRALTHNDVGVHLLPHAQLDDHGVDDDGFADDGVVRRRRASRQPNDDGDEHRRRRDRPRRERPTLVAHGEVSIQIDSARRSKRAAMSAVPVWLVDTMPTISRFGPAGTSNITRRDRCRRARSGRGRPHAPWVGMQSLSVGRVPDGRSPPQSLRDSSPRKRGERGNVASRQVSSGGAISGRGCAVRRARGGTLPRAAVRLCARLSEVSSRHLFPPNDRRVSGSS